MSCKSCGSHSQHRFNGEIAIHFPGLKGLDMPIVWVFTPILVCLTCCLAQFEVPKQEVRVLSDRTEPSSV
jgi:hypothetical protein